MLTRFSTQLTRPCLHSFLWRRFTNESIAQGTNGGTRNVEDVSPNIARRVRAVRSSLGLKGEIECKLSRWKDVLEADDMHEALKIAGDGIKHAPIPLLYYLLDTKVRSPTQAVAAASMVLVYDAEQAVRPYLLVLLVRALAKHQVATPMHDVVNAFLALDLDKPHAQFNLLLQAMSHFRFNTVLAKLTSAILVAMGGRQVRLNAHTYRALLSNKIVTLELTKVLQRKMEAEGFQPGVRHMEAYLRVFGKGGAVHASARYLSLIREHQLKASKVAPFGVDLTSKGAKLNSAAQSANTHWNTMFMRSFNRNADSAFHYLRELVNEGPNALHEPLRAPRRQSRLSSLSSRLPTFSLQRKTPSTLTRKTAASVRDWTTSLHAAALNPKITGERLLHIFDVSRKSARYKPTISTYTAIIRGLVKKGEYPAAFNMWKVLYRRRSVRARLDVKALTAAIDVLVWNNPVEAFRIILDTTRLLRDPTTAFKGRSRAKADVKLVNAFMASLIKHGHPNVVFTLWDVCTPLFDVYPSAETLTALLKAAKDATLSDRTLKAVWVRARLFRNPFQQRVSVPTYSLMSKDKIAEIVRTKLEESEEAKHRQGSLRSVSLWNDKPAGLKALELFQFILFNNFPFLRALNPPARAVWSDEAFTANPVRDLIQDIGFKRDISDVDVKPDSGLSSCAMPDHAQDKHSSGPLSSNGISRPFNSQFKYDPSEYRAYPQIVPQEKAFFAYIELLGAERRASQVPLALLYMQKLHIVPYKDTLALALVLWAEVSLRGPIIERNGRWSEYERFRRFLVAWVGKDRMPTEFKMEKYRRILFREREMRRESETLL